MLAMKVKNAKNPIVVSPSMTLDTGASSPSQPAKTATTRPSHRSTAARPTSSGSQTHTAGR